MEHIQRTHPFGVTLGEVVVDRDHMYTVACQCVEEHGEGCHEGLTFTRRHLSNLALMQHRATEELHVVVNHVPHGLVAASHPVIVVDGFVAVDVHKVVTSSQFAVEVGGCDHDVLVVGEALSGALDDGESNGTNLIQHLFKDLQLVFLQLVDFLENGLAVLDGRLLDGGLQFVDLCADGLACLTDLSL